MHASPLNRQKILDQISFKNMGTIHIFDSLESTSDTMRKLVQAGAGHGTLVAAETQTKGRGRYGRYFHSPAGSGIYFSLLLEKTKIHLEDISLLTIFAGVHVCRALRKLTGKNIEIKWINDIFLKGKKVGGILVEAVGNCYILGIGLNVTPPTTDFPAEIGEIVEFLYSGNEQAISRNEIISRIVSNILDAPSTSAQLLTEYKSYSAVLGKTVTVSEGKTSYEARALDIDDSGQLVVQKQDGSIAKLCSGEVRIKL